MKFSFHIKNAAINNSWEAHRRESTRMACIALAMERAGHDVRIVDVSPQYMECPNWQFFKHLSGGHHGGFTVYPAEMLRRGQSGVDIAFRCSVGTMFDQQYIPQCRLLVAHEYAKSVENEPKLLPIPFLIHNEVITYLMGAGLLDAYIDNDIEAIRDHFREHATVHEELVGFIGADWPSRKTMCEHPPAWASVTFYDHVGTRRMEADEHCRWLMGFRAALAMSGSSPKTNLTPLLAMLGIPMFLEPLPVLDTPPMDASNSVPFTGWASVAAAIENTSLLYCVSEKATTDYINGWSPAGIAASIATRASDF